MSIFDIDLESGLPPWNFQVQFRGQLLKVKLPNGEQLSRIIDAGNINCLQACKLLSDLFSEVTGIDRAVVNELDAEVICSFTIQLGDLVQKRLAIKAALRGKSPLITPPVANNATRLN